MISPGEQVRAHTCTAGWEKEGGSHARDRGLLTTLCSRHQLGTVSVPAPPSILGGSETHQTSWFPLLG